MNEIEYTIDGNVMVINDGEYTITIDPESFIRKDGRAWYWFSFSHGDKVIVPEGCAYAIFSPAPMRDKMFDLFGEAAFFMTVNHGHGVDDDFFEGFTPEHEAWLDSYEQEEFSCLLEDIWERQKKINDLLKRVSGMIGNARLDVFQGDWRRASQRTRVDIASYLSDWSVPLDHLLNCCEADLQGLAQLKGATWGDKESLEKAGIGDVYALSQEIGELLKEINGEN